MTQDQVYKWLKENDPMLYYLSLSKQSLADGNLELRDLGKLFADPNEYIQLDYINENTSLKVIKRKDGDLNGGGFDLITIYYILKIQSKLRAGAIHLEQTRRKSKKNLNSSDTGHVRYSVGEADVYVFSRPDCSDYLNLKKWQFIAIPEKALIDPKNQKYLLPRVPKGIWKNYVGKFVEILEKTYLEKMNCEYSGLPSPKAYSKKLS